MASAPTSVLGKVEAAKIFYPHSFLESFIEAGKDNTSSVTL